MAKVQKKKTKQKKSIKKKFFPVESKLTSTKIKLYSTTPEKLEGKVIKIDLTKILRGKSFELKLKVINKEEKLTTSPTSLQLTQSYVKKTVRKGTDYSEDSFEVDTKDSKIRVKPLLITRKRVSRLILKVLRENTKKEITDYMKIRSTNEIFSDIISNKLQKSLSIKLKKIYPLALSEIRAIKVVSNIQKQ